MFVRVSAIRISCRFVSAGDISNVKSRGLCPNKREKWPLKPGSRISPGVRNNPLAETYSLKGPDSNRIQALTGGSKDWKSLSERSRRLALTGAYGKAAKFRRQKKAAKTLGIVVGCFLLCWFPFFLILPLDAACTSCDLSGTVFNLTFWLGYFNSCLNPLIYACSSRELRRAFLCIICCQEKFPGRNRYLSNPEQSN